MELPGDEAGTAALWKYCKDGSKGFCIMYYARRSVKNKRIAQAKLQSAVPMKLADSC